MVSFFSAELTAAKKLPFLLQPENISALRIFVGFTNCGLVSVGAMGAVYVYLKVLILSWNRRGSDITFETYSTLNNCKQYKINE